MRRLQAIVFWAAVAAVLSAAVALGGNRPYFWTPLAVVALGLFAVQCVIDVIGGGASRLSWRLALASILFTGVLVWAALQAATGVWPASFAAVVAPVDWSAATPSTWAISVNPAASWSGLLRLASYGAFFFIAYAAASDADRARLFIDVVAVWSGALALYGLVAHLSGVNPVLGALEAYAALEATFINRNAYALYAVIGLVANLAAFARRATSGDAIDADQAQAFRRLVEAMEKGGWVFVSGAAACLVALLLTLSRGGVLVGAIGVLVFAALYFRKRYAVSRPALRGVVAAAVILALLGVSGVMGRFGDRSFAEDARATLFQHLLEPIAERPLTGYGLGAFRDAFRPYAPREFAEKDWDLAHNSYLENAVELGVVGAVALTVAIALVWLESVVGALRRRRRLEAPCVAAAVGVAGAAHATVDFSLQMPATAALFAMILGVGAAQSRKRSRRTNPATA